MMTFKLNNFLIFFFSVMLKHEEYMFVEVSSRH